MASKQIGIKEKEQNRKNPVLGMISSEVAGMAAETAVNDQIHLENDSQSDNESETIESLKKQLEEARAASIPACPPPITITENSPLK